MCTVVPENPPLPFHNRLKSRCRITVIGTRSFIYHDPDTPLRFVILFDFPFSFFTSPNWNLLTPTRFFPSRSSGALPDLPNLLPPIFSPSELLQVPHNPPAKSFAAPLSCNSRSFSTILPLSPTPGDDPLINFLVDLADLFNYPTNSHYPLTHTDFPTSSHGSIHLIHYTNLFIHRVCHCGWHCLREREYLVFYIAAKFFDF
ncbi:hypothetical protein C7212DRAFT_205268 [Tuber magnatum]|uniref:Uncharacterized protein n=1 Tax=Tuber magnatum TaxID=42249 RepID=A0A317SKZ0_9PEZI|nr:hypothetical protein C7212DRAFT_205268 [Tuber magnatum]